MQYRVSQPQRFHVRGHTYFFVPGTGSLVEADASALALSDRFGEERFVPEEVLNDFLESSPDRQSAKETIEGFFTFGILAGPELYQIKRREITAAPIPVKHLITSVSQACNLRCGYCYADFGHYQREPDMMQLETSRKYVDFLLENSGDASRLVYTFFGGEPLLNFPVIKEAVRYGREREKALGKKITFGLTTNGTLLNEEMIDFFCKEEMEITISVDGIGEANDRLRPFAGGRGSYDILLKKVKPLLERKPTPARVTVTNQNLDLVETFDELTRVGFTEVGFSPVSSADPRYALTPEDHARFVDRLEDLTKKTLSAMNEGRILGFSNFLQLVRQIHDADMHSHPCGAAQSLVAGNSDGELYACHRLINDTEFSLGSLEDGVDREAQAGHLERLHVDHKAPCETCWAQGLCGGGCYAVAKTETGASDNVPWEHCDSLRRWYRVGIEGYVHLSVHHPEAISRMAVASLTQENYQDAPV